jgi:glyoxylase-like metal-dependent hydrolase (beta-lactamase superfamily II)
MKLWAMEGNRQCLDGGAMFGNVPQALWSRWFKPDEQNRIELACRALLVQEDCGRLILFETGIGAFFEPKMKDRFGVAQDRHVLLDNLKSAGFSPADIDVVVLSHLHFDHAGGLLTAWSAENQSELCFPNAEFLVSSDGWQRAQTPHYRDRASFIPHLNQLLASSGRLHVVDGSTSPLLGPNYCFHYSQGHTPGLMLCEISTQRGPIVFAGDLSPGSTWVHLPITMGYDRFPECLIDEKQALLTDLLQRGGSLFFTHDPEVALGRVDKDLKGRFSVVDPVMSAALVAREY